MIQFKTQSGKILDFEDKPLNKGGEGAVYKQFDASGHGDIGDLAKVFFQGKEGGKAEKIAAMLSIGSPKPSDCYTWPKDILYDVSTGEFRGYVMYLKPNKKEIGEICGYNSLFRKKKDWRFYVHAAKNLAKAVMGVHSIKQVIGDLNNNNILIDNNTEVTLIDTDSFHITTGSKKNRVIYRCNVGMSEYIAPEIHGINFRDADLPTFTEHTDNFSLAILVFKLLMNGLHPFNSAMIDNKSIEENMRSGSVPCFMKLKKGQSVEAPYAPFVDMLPKELCNLFKRAFIDSANAPKKRPSAKEFHDELEKLANDENIKQCSVNVNHKFPNESSVCPWCVVNYKMGCLTRGEDIPVNVKIIASSSVSQHSINNTTSSVKVPFTGPTLPSPIAKSKMVGSIIGCIFILFYVTTIISLGFLVGLSPIFLFITAISASIIAFLRLPKLDYNNGFYSKPLVPTYFTVKYKQNKCTKFTLVSMPRLWLFNVLCICVFLPLIALIILDIVLFHSYLLTFIPLTTIGVFGSLFIFEKRTLWTKNISGIIMGIISIIAIISTFLFFINLLIHWF